MQRVAAIMTLPMFELWLQLDFKVELITLLSTAMLDSRLTSGMWKKQPLGSCVTRHRSMAGTLTDSMSASTHVDWVLTNLAQFWLLMRLTTRVNQLFNNVLAYFHNSFELQIGTSQNEE